MGWRRLLNSIDIIGRTLAHVGDVVVKMILQSVTDMHEKQSCRAVAQAIGV
jgi:hypothetical protein